MFRSVSAKPDLIGAEHEMLARWRERRTFARLRAQNAGGPRWSFLDGPITANNPMGVHHAWGRAYKDLFQRFHAMLGDDQRYQNGFDCQGLWVEVNVERDLGFTSKRDIEAYGIAEFVSLCKQRVLTYAARQTEQSIRLGMWMDWNEPEELRRLRDLLAADPAATTTIEGPAGPVTDSVEMLVGRLGMPEVGGSYFTFSNENNDLIWGFLAECHRRGWLYKGHDTMPWCTRCGTGMSQHEMTEGYRDRDDPGLTIKLPLVDRPGEALLVWTTTPWTLTSNVAAAVGPNLRYVQVRQADAIYWLAKGTLKTALDPAGGRIEVLGELLGSELVGWRYDGPFDDLPAVGRAFAATDDRPAYEHLVVPWSEVGEAEGTGIVHIAPGCGSEDFALGRDLGLPVIAPLDEGGHYVDGFGAYTGRDVRDVTEPIVEHLRHHHRFYRLETITHRYPHCWRCGTPLVYRLVDEWFIRMGRVYDRPRSELTAAEVDDSLRYQIMAVVDDVRWIPGFGYERELDWLLNMHDWMISKKRYYGLALPIYDCPACGTVEVIGGRDELRERAVEGWPEFEGHTPHRPYVDAVRIACPGCGAAVTRIPDVGNPWLDAGIVPFSTLHYREDPDYWSKWFPADFITESFPGQFRNWFYAMLAMSTVLRREAPYRTIFGYATLLAEDGAPMHKSAGNAIEFDDAAERMGVDVMRWMYAIARPDDNILFGWQAADEARRRLLILWNVYAFFVTYARLSGWAPADHGPSASAGLPVIDRWIRSRVAGLAARAEELLGDYDANGAARAIEEVIDDLSTWYLRRSRRRFSRVVEPADREAAFATLHGVLVALARVMAPILPFLTDEMYDNLVARGDPSAPDSVHLTRWPAAELAGDRDLALETAMATIRRAVELVRGLRSAAGIKVRQPLARLWLALPGAELAERQELLALLADEVNVKEIELIGDESALVERRVRPLLPRIGRKFGDQVPAIMAAARAGAFEIRADGGVDLAGLSLAADEVEILASPRPGTAVAHDEGLVVVIDTELSPDLLAEGDVRELQRAIQDLRREAELELDARIEVWLEPWPDALAGRFEGLRADTLAERLGPGPLPDGVPASTVELNSGALSLALQPIAGGRQPGA
ncbi:MAG TPA: class I tRNA ligase family protein [Candidatus Limnocylindrales bacterium]